MAGRVSGYTGTTGRFRSIPGTIKYEALEAVIWEVGVKGSGLVVEAPRGTIFDVSIPWVVRFVLDPHDRRFLKAAAIHDVIRLRNWDRVTAGAIFHEALKADGVGKAKRLVMWLTVSLYHWH